jgi:hypothetical protein
MGTYSELWLAWWLRGAATERRGYTRQWVVLSTRRGCQFDGFCSLTIGDCGARERERMDGQCPTLNMERPMGWTAWEQRTTEMLRRAQHDNMGGRREGTRRVRAPFGLTQGRRRARLQGEESRKGHKLRNEPNCHFVSYGLILLSDRELGKSSHLNGDVENEAKVRHMGLRGG